MPQRSPAPPLALPEWAPRRNNVLFFDGVCNLCNGAVQFVIRHDKEAKVSFAALQSPLGDWVKEELMKRDGRVPDSLVFFQGGQLYTESDAALRAGALLSAPYRWMKAWLVFPHSLRNWAYRIVARNRYRWFGKKDACMLPMPALKQRFIDGL